MKNPFKVGDLVRIAHKPEWGIGEVLDAGIISPGLVKVKWQNRMVGIQKTSISQKIPSNE